MITEVSKSKGPRRKREAGLSRKSAILSMLILALVGIAAVHHTAFSLSFGFYNGFHQDFDADGKLTRHDATASAERHFVRLDKNSDGSIDAADFDEKRVNGSTRTKRMEMMLGMIDQDSDDSVSKQEFISYATRRFDMVDTDQNGELSEPELQVAHEIIYAARLRETFRLLDLNGDGQITGVEYNTYKIQRQGQQGAVPVRN